MSHFNKYSWPNFKLTFTLYLTQSIKTEIIFSTCSSSTFLVTLENQLSLQDLDKTHHILSIKLLLLLISNLRISSKSYSPAEYRASLLIREERRPGEGVRRAKKVILEMPSVRRRHHCPVLSCVLVCSESYWNS